MEVSKVTTTPRAGDRRQRAFNQLGTPKPVFFDKVSLRQIFALFPVLDRLVVIFY